MALTKLEKVSLATLAEEPAKLTRFFDQLISHYDKLKNEKAKRQFLRRLLAWNETTFQGIFAHANKVNHKKAIQLFITTRAFRGLPAPFTPGESYTTYLGAAYAKLKSPFQTTLNNALKILPTVLQNIVFSYAIPTQENSLTKDERTAEQTLMYTTHKPIPCKPLTLPPETAEVSLFNHNLKNELTAAKRKYLFAIFSEFLIGLLWLALKIAMITVLCVGLDFIPIVPVVFIFIGIMAGWLFSNGRCIPTLIYPLVSIYETFCSKHSSLNKLNTYAMGTAESYANINRALYGLAVISLMAFALGVLSLLPPLGLAIPVLAWTVAAGLTMTGSVAALGFFHFNKKSERGAILQFQETIADCVAEPTPTLEV